MAKLTKSDNGYWIGHEMTNGSSYSTTDSYVELPRKQVKIATTDQIKEDIEKYLNVTVGQNCHATTFKVLARELCNSKWGMIYCIDYRANYGVRKIFQSTVPSV